MKRISVGAFQGDCMFRRVDSLPSDAAEAKKAPGKMVLAHSETGHHHSILDVTDVYRFEVSNPNVCYLRIEAQFADVVHERSFDTHETLRLVGNGLIWECRRQREWTPEGWKRVED